SEVKGTKLDRAYIGSCTGGKLTDFRAAAGIMKGKSVRIDTFVVPATSEIAAGLKRERIGNQTLEEVFLAAGAKIGEPSCAACLGGPSDTFGRLNAPMSCISTTNRNFPGRDVGQVPQAEAAAEGGQVVAQTRARRQHLDLLGVAAADDDVIDHERRGQRGHGVTQRLAPRLLADPGQPLAPQRLAERAAA